MKDIFNPQKMEHMIQKMAHDIIQSGLPLQKIALVGIRTRGVPLAQRLARLISQEMKEEVPVGVLDITLYRDDLSQLSTHPLIKKTEIPFSIDTKIVYLVDDVLYTGRTIRSAMDALIDFGRPKAIKLAVLIDRGGRELPIQPDIVGSRYAAESSEVVHVKFREIDGEEGIELIEHNARIK